jgi:hypothetical protein
MKYEYWFCTIGPVEKSKIPLGGDFPMRTAVKDAVEKMSGDENITCSSGWGRTGEMVHLIEKLDCMRIQDPKRFEFLRKTIMNMKYGDNNENNTNTDNLLL